MDMIIKNILVYQTFTQQFEMKDVLIENGRFSRIADELSITHEEVMDGTGKWMIPGLIDIHMHIESSMTLPSRFSQAVLPHGVTTVVADPHEIANVFGLEGIQSFLSNATALDIFYGIPSSVPSTSPQLETTGGFIGVEEVKELLQHPVILCLGEVMNFQDLCKKETSTIKEIIKVCQALRPSLPIEGHCPKISGKDLADFIGAGVTADHTQQTPESIIEKIKSGMFLEIQKKSMNKEHTLIRLVDDDESLLFSTKILLEVLGWKVAAYNSPAEFLVRDNLSIPGCAVLDVRMPQMTGLEVQETLIERGFAHFPLIFLSGHGDIQMAVNAMSKGALTFLEKPVDPERLNQEVTKAVELGIRRAEEVNELNALKRRYRQLTNREKEVLSLVAEGLTNKEIADRLELSVPTIKMHRSRASEKLAMDSVAEITRALILLNEASAK